MNVKNIAATLAILGSGALVIGCGKDKPSTEVPGGAEGTPTDDAADPTDAAGDAAGDAGEGKCGGEDHEGEGHCGADEAGDEAAPEGEAS
jgi:hypothetical protein